MWDFVQVVAVVTRVMESGFGNLGASAVGSFGRCLAPRKSVFLRHGRRPSGIFGSWVPCELRLCGSSSRKTMTPTIRQGGLVIWGCDLEIKGPRLLELINFQGLGPRWVSVGLADRLGLGNEAKRKGLGSTLDKEAGPMVYLMELGPVGLRLQGGLESGLQSFGRELTLELGIQCFDKGFEEFWGWALGGWGYKAWEKTNCGKRKVPGSLVRQPPTLHEHILKEFGNSLLAERNLSDLGLFWHGRLGATTLVSLDLDSYGPCRSARWLGSCVSELGYCLV
ncbi:unnamed protein product [Prunus armeniaca]|uniref:Uncharacterized protein n=1 Tax=Prunus armeniaca TaxID=36596 RepID=A0A6J5Y7C6_PRUAR|nr:unnamed protein product [Prunus armeniaca]